MAIALEDLVPVDRAALEVVRAGVVCLFPAGAEELIDDASGLLELAIGEDALLADLEAADRADQAGRPVNDVRHRGVASSEREGLPGRQSDDHRGRGQPLFVGAVGEPILDSSHQLWGHAGEAVEELVECHRRFHQIASLLAKQIDEESRL